jgi:S-ribosylhomocysteine lyase
MAKIKTVVESFELDHDAVIAPYIRKIGTETGVNGDIITNFDIRFTQPNAEAIDTSSIHTLEHSLAGLVRDNLSGLSDSNGTPIRLIDASPFGCLTGFHAIFWGEPTVKQVRDAYVASLETLLTFEQEDVPGLERKSCGNYKMHSLFGAKEWAKLTLDRKFSLDPFERIF